MKHQRIPFAADKIYHLYNHGNGDDLIFRSESNYRFFLQKYAQYLNPVSDTFAYCLMPNHFHFLIRIKSHEALESFFFRPDGAWKDSDLSKLVSQQYSHFLNSYAKSFNKMYERKGSLFLDNIKRKEVTHEDYYTKLIHYIHYNPVHHGFVKRLTNWPHSSYHALLSDKKTALYRQEVLDWFGGREEFENFHQYSPEPPLSLAMEY
jgi:putative transposase